MSYLKTVCGLLALLVSGMAWSADTLTPEQKEVKQLVEKMYSYDPITFEVGYFLKKTGAPLLINQVPAAFSAIKFLPEKISFAVFDGDLYESTKHVLPYVYERMSPGAIGMIAVYYDEKIFPRKGIQGGYMSPGVKRATDEFFKDKPRKVIRAIKRS